MLNSTDFRQISIDLGIPLPYIEKDYAMGWILWALSSDPILSNSLVLKGGNCLRKIYFPGTRFSDDLDFTSLSFTSADTLEGRLKSVCDMVSDASGIHFKRDATSVKEHETPDKECRAFDGRVYFKGFAGDESVTFRVKFDISEYEKIVLPTSRLPLIHQYADCDSCSCNVLTYSLEEVLAEKLRSWLQRTRPRDLFDVVQILQSGAIPISKRRILSVFLQKTIYKGILVAGRDELLSELKFATVEKTWLETIVCPSNAVIAFVNAIALFKQFINALFEPDIATAIGQSVVPQRIYRINPEIREAIIEAGKARNLVRLRYAGKDRNVEPYSFRFKNGVEYFFGFDQSRGQTIKSFFLHRIENATLLPQKYLPRWSVEF